MSNQTEMEIEAEPEGKVKERPEHVYNEERGRWEVVLSPEGIPPFLVTSDRPFKEVARDILRDALRILRSRSV